MQPMIPRAKKVEPTAHQQPTSYYESNAQRSSEGMGARIDAGLRAYMQRVYGYMAGGLALTGIRRRFLPGHRATPLIWIVMLAPLGFVLVLSFGIQRMSAAATVLFWIYAAVMGLSLGGIFLVFTGASIARVLHHCGNLRRDEPLRLFHEIRSFGCRSSRGDLLASSSRLSSTSLSGQAPFKFTVSVIGVLVFVSLTAYDMQRIKEMYLESDTAEIADKKAVLGALALYLDFINLFMMLLQLFGQRREN
jgi:FtsH-binding integral membrane protein